MSDPIMEGFWRMGAVFARRDWFEGNYGYWTDGPWTCVVEGAD
jgi:hypothetical protein